MLENAWSGASHARASVRVGDARAFSEAMLFLDRVHRAFLRGDIALPFEALLCVLHQLRARWDDSSWHRFCQTVCHEHPIRGVLREDPFTRRSLDKPRGYAGDAVMLDYIYGGLSAAEASGTSERGKAIFEKTAVSSGSAMAVRARKKLIARRIEAVAERTPNARILSVACGHLREALESPSLSRGRVRELVGVDQDGLSLEVVARDLAGLPVTPVAASVRDILSGRTNLSRFDFAYSAGLTDYLDDETTIRLATSMLTALNPGGCLLLANFVPGFAPAAYMEAFMEWRLTYRTASDLRSLSNSLPTGMVSDRRSFVDESGHIAYLELTRAE